MAWPSTSSPSSPGIFLDHPAPPHHHELSRLRGLPRAPSVAGGSQIICLANAQVPSRSSAARRWDKESVVPPVVFLSSVFRRILLHQQQLRRTRPSVPAPTGRTTPSIYISVAPPATIPNISPRPYAVAPSNALLGGAPLPEASPFSSPIRLPPRPRPKVGTPQPPVPLLLQCLPTFASAVTPRGQRVTAYRPWHQIMAAAHPGTGGIERKMASDQRVTIFTTKMGGDYLEVVTDPSRGCLDIKMEYNLWRANRELKTTTILGGHSLRPQNMGGGILLAPLTSWRRQWHLLSLAPVGLFQRQACGVTRIDRFISIVPVDFTYVDVIINHNLDYHSTQSVFCNRARTMAMKLVVLALFHDIRPEE